MKFQEFSIRKSDDKVRLDGWTFDPFDIDEAINAALTNRLQAIFSKGGAQGAVELLPTENNAAVIEVTIEVQECEAVCGMRMTLAELVETWSAIWDEEDRHRLADELMRIAKELRDED